MRALVYGFAIAGESTVRALLRHGHEVVVVDDRIDDTKRDLADALGVELLHTPLDPGAFACQFDVIVPAPGVPETHPIVVSAQRAGVPLVSEIELGYRWEQERPGGPRPILAVTGTDGKTTTTDMTVAMLRAAGRRAEAVGNTDVPFVDAIDTDLDVFVIECSSFRLAWTEQFRADAAVWLNFAPDHLNWHRSLESYEATKARIFSLQSATDVAVGFADDLTVMRHLADAPGRRCSFGLEHGDYRLDGTTLVGPLGPIADTAAMARSLPHDITNALAASALVLETGLADADAIATALATFAAQPHRLEEIGRAGGVTWYNDSKATTPHAAATAIRAFDSLVLIAGGSRKGVDLSPMATTGSRVRAVVAIGEAAPDVSAVFADSTDVTVADSMADAVALAGERAEPGDAVVLSPGCASFDWYVGYHARGDDFRRLVRERLALPGDTVSPTLEATA
ncbi:MAG: UDP-N-acetylmuramoyl-L-alanine--D-glutamate ligase [Ilumatobacteraceae bacterium]|nr:UDP-N-acetylmuramoyl-L-alanine--D-glutamate ligase [Ilumatobacteraceae bacterium]